MSINIDIIRSSFDKAKPIADQVADKFYEFLWDDYPQSKELFEGVKMPQQKKALMGSLVYIVDHIDQASKLVPYLEKMGSRHVGYGTKDEHYAWVGSSLIKTFAHFFGDDWTQELQDEWIAAYTFIADTMKSGAQEQVPDLNDLQSKAKEVCNTLLRDILDEEIDEEFESIVRSKVRKVLYKVLEEESESLLKKAS